MTDSNIFNSSTSSQNHITKHDHDTSDEKILENVKIKQDDGNSTLQNRMYTSLKFVTLVRCAYAALVLIYSFLWYFVASDIQFQFELSSEIMFGCIVEIFLFTGISSFCLLKNRFILPVTIIGMVNDAFLAAIIVLLTGYYNSPFQYLFLIIPLYGGITLRKRGGFIGAIIVSVVVTALYFLPELFVQYIPADVLQVLFPYISNNNEILNRFISLILAGVGVGFLTGHLAYQYAKVQAKLENEREFTRFKDIYKEIVQALPIGVIIVNSSNDKVLYSNPIAEKILGVPASNILLPEFQNPIPVAGSVITENSWVVQNDNKYLRLARFEMRLPNITPLTAYHVTDVTDIQIAQLEQVRKQRLVLLGEFSAKVAHEIRNPLACISGCSEMLLQDDLDKSEQHQVLEMMGSEIDRLNALLNDILVFSRRPKLSPKLLNVLNFFESRKDIFLSDTANQNIRVELKIPSEFEWNIDENSFSQIVMTMWRNSVEAMNGNGTLIVSQQDSGLLFQDSGPGVSPDVASRIFEPFFTTKNNGTGLGLAIARQIAFDNGFEVLWDANLKGFTLKLLTDSASGQRMTAEMQ